MNRKNLTTMKMTVINLTAWPGRLLVLTMACLLALSAWSGNYAAGKAKSSKCVACHGKNGVSSNPLWPNLAGQNKAYLVKQLKDFRSGTRKDTQMRYWSRGLSDADIENLAEYYSGMKPVCKPRGKTVSKKPKKK